MRARVQSVAAGPEGAIQISLPARITGAGYDETDVALENGLRRRDERCANGAGWRYRCTGESEWHGGALSRDVLER